MAGVDLTRLNQVAAEIGTGDGGGWAYKRLKLVEGKTVIRMLPPFEGRDGLFFARVMESFNVGPSGKKIIPPSQFGLPDPLMDEIQRLKASGDKASLKRANSMVAKKRAHIWVIVRSVNGAVNDAETGQSWESYGPQLWSISNWLLGDIISIFNDPDYGDITDIDNGRDLNIDYIPKEKTVNGFPDWKFRARPVQTPLGDPSWVSEDLYEKYRICEPSDADYIIACLKGTEKAFLAAKKQERDDDKEEAQPRQAAPPAASVPSPAPAGSADEAVQASLAEIRKANLKKAQRAGLDIDRRHEKELLPPPSTTAPELMTQEFWAGVNGATVKLSGSVIQESYVNKGMGDKIQLMTLDQADGWKTATTRGFHAVAAAPPPPPASVPPPPPAGESVGSDLQNALR